MESNTPKIAGLLQTLNSDAFVSVRDVDLENRVFSRLLEYVQQPHRRLLDEQRKAELRELSLKNFA